MLFLFSIFRVFRYVLILRSRLNVYARRRRAAFQDTLAVRRCLAEVQRSSFSLAPLLAGSIA